LIGRELLSKKGRPKASLGDQRLDIVTEYTRLGAGGSQDTGQSVARPCRTRILMVT
jgi:hypothetical protein